MNQYAESTRKETLLLIALSTGMAASFFFLFLIKNRGLLDFWWWFTVILSLFLLLVILFDREFLHSLVKDVKEKTARKLLYGMISAAVLYAVFLLVIVFSVRSCPLPSPEYEIYIDSEKASLYGGLPSSLPSSSARAKNCCGED